MPSVSATAASGVSYAAVTKDGTTFFAPVMKASGGLLTSSTLKTVKIGGKDVATVAVYAVKSGLSKSSMFQDQYVAQLLQSVSKQKAAPRFVRINGRVVALTAGTPAVAGWFEGEHVVLVYRTGATPDLAALALSVLRQPSGR
jgi:hypothetical protein